MIERLLLKHLTKTGKIAYFVGIIISFILVAYYIFEIMGKSLESGRDHFVIGIVTVNIIWAIICYFLWRKEKEETKE
ncbi:hypothetical protein [Tenacibaculum xiamenense]|uniref:hypothetical protein n=1 Tax=Tenacibaculum xiamenense TaxID=1261553 RepID=UPI003892D0B2